MNQVVEEYIKSLGENQVLIENVFILPSYHVNDFDEDDDWEYEEDD